MISSTVLQTKQEAVLTETLRDTRGMRPGMEVGDGVPAQHAQGPRFYPRDLKYLLKTQGERGHLSLTADRKRCQSDVLQYGLGWVCLNRVWEEAWLYGGQGGYHRQKVSQHCLKLSWFCSQPYSCEQSGEESVLCPSQSQKTPSESWRECGPRFLLLHFGLSEFL